MNSFRLYIGLGMAVLALVIFLVFFPEILSGARTVKVGLSSLAETIVQSDTIAALKAENAFLKIQTGSKNESRPKEPEVSVYSMYPFNDKSVLIIDFGAKSGANIGMPVLTQSGALVGRITKVKKSQSEVETLLNKNWATSVFIGDAEINGVLKGNVFPRIELVASDAKVHEGDLVKNGSPDLPLNVLVGEIKEIEIGEGEFFANLTVDSYFDPSALKKVVVITNFP